MDDGEAARGSRNPKSFAGELASIAREAGRQSPLGQMQAHPCPPRADFGTRAAHPAGEVLEVADRVSEVARVSIGGVPQDPNERLIGMSMIARMLGHPGLVDLEDRLGRLSADPLGLGITQRVLIERGPALVAVPPRDREIMNFFHLGQPGTGRIHAKQLWIRDCGPRAKSMRSISEIPPV